VLAIWPVFCYDLCYVCDCGFVLADKFIKVKVKSRHKSVF